VASDPQRTVAITESNITHLAQAIRDGRAIYHACKLTQRGGCEVVKLVDESSPATIAETLTLVFFDPCCEFLSVTVSDRTV
jgi:hypothetical protein